MTLHQNVLGVDVARDWVDVFDPSDNHSTRVRTQDLHDFAARLAPETFVVFEASGGYERPLMEALRGAGIAHVRANPRQVREFARATGRLAKTDKVDARVLAEMGRALDLRPEPPADPARERLAELVARRADIVSALTAETQRQAMARDAFVRRDIARMLAVLRLRRAAIEKEIAAQIRSCEKLAAAEALLRSAPGIGPVLAAILLAWLPELGRLDRRAIASLAGLAPHACDSGHRRGKRHIWGGRSQLRSALYLAAMTASRTDPALKAQKQRFQALGKPPKVALLAIARKLLTILNAMVRDQRTYA
jgi:transposase